jgi:hypothetical protein
VIRAAPDVISDVEPVRGEVADRVAEIPAVHPHLGPGQYAVERQPESGPVIF